jgi:hypothetical protein
MSSTDKWSTAGPNILAADQLAAVRHHLENVGFIVLLWGHYRGSKAPTRLTFDDFGEFEAFLMSQPTKGDSIHVWPFPEDPAQRIAGGKIPNELGEVPEGGAY